jgi:putative ABC transport system substrate-binding protein
MRRRDALGAIGLAGLAGWVDPTAAQERRPRIGYLGPAADTAPHLVRAFQDGLRELGYVDGRTIAIDYRWTTREGGLVVDPAELLRLARNLVARPVDVIAASVVPAIAAARQATKSVPIVMMNGSDVIDLGFVATLARPGGNITGLTRLTSELIGKNMQFLAEAVPSARRIGLLLTTSGRVSRAAIRNARQAASARGLVLQVAEVKDGSELEAAFAALKRDQAQALLVTSDNLFFTQRAQLAEFALELRLPTMFAATENVDAGGLLAYSPSSADSFRRAAYFIDKILHGAKPGDIPVEQPSKFELAVNLKTAKAIGLTIPAALLLRADVVVE